MGTTHIQIPNRSDTSNRAIISRGNRDGAGSNSMHTKYRTYPRINKFQIVLPGTSSFHYTLDFPIQ